MFLDTPERKIAKKLEETLGEFSTKTKRSSFSEEEKHLITSILYSGYGILRGLLDGVQMKEMDLENYLDGNANIQEAFLIACFIKLSILKERMKNKEELRERIDFDSLIASVSDILNQSPNLAITYLQDFQESLKNADEDPRDLWLEQDLQLLQIILKRDFDIRAHFQGNLARTLMLSTLSQMIRVEITKGFDEMLSMKL